MKINPELMPERVLKDLGMKAQRTYGLVRKHTDATRRNWVKIGEYATEVSDAAPRGSGNLSRWREQYLPEVSAGLLSDAIWMANHPKAAKLVPDTLTNPNTIRHKWRAIAKQETAAFVANRVNNPRALGEKLGISAAEAHQLIADAQRAQERHDARIAKGKADDAATQREAAIAGKTGFMFNDPIPGGDVLTGNDAIRQAIVHIDGYDTKAARETLLDALHAPTPQSAEKALREAIRDIEAAGDERLKNVLFHMRGAVLELKELREAGGDDE